MAKSKTSEDEHTARAIIPARDYSDVCKMMDPTVMEEFMQQPFPFIAETITGVIANGPKQLALASGRIVQGVLRGRMFEQFGREMRHLRATGAIPDDFADKKYGFQTWSELLNIIDTDPPDEERLAALKAMFLAVNRISAADADRNVAFQLWQITKRLSSGELLVLKAAYENHAKFPTEPMNYSVWARRIADYCGHSIATLVEICDEPLVRYGLLQGRSNQGMTVHGADGRLTELGFRFCRNIQEYSIAVELK